MAAYKLRLTVWDKTREAYIDDFNQWTVGDTLEEKLVEQHLQQFAETWASEDYPPIPNKWAAAVFVAHPEAEILEGPPPEPEDPDIDY